MSRRALPADAAFPRTALPGRATTWALPSPRHLADYVLTTLGLLVGAGLLFWRQPALLSAPFDVVFTYLNMVQTFQWQLPGAPMARGRRGTLAGEMARRGSRGSLPYEEVAPWDWSC